MKLLKLAKADIAAGESSFRSAANQIAIAISNGATQAEAAKVIGKSQPWISRLLKWREGGFKGGPFAHPAEDNYYPGNKAGEEEPETAEEEPKKEYMTVKVVHRKQKITAPYFVKRDPESEAANAAAEETTADIEEAADVGAPSMPAPAKSSTTFSLATRRKMVKETLDYLMKAWFGGDAAAMWAAIDECRAHQEGRSRSVAGEAAGDSVLH